VGVRHRSASNSSEPPFCPLSSISEISGAPSAAALVSRGNAAGSRSRELATQSLLPFRVAWSLDSREIVFESEASGQSEIWLIGADGEAPGWLACLAELRSRPGRGMASESFFIRMRNHRMGAIYVIPTKRRNSALER
jgi:hypothetical protein